jgi:hypothetical protein
MRLALVLCAVLRISAQQVTDTVTVNADNDRQELLRKINGRWFSQDNREVNPPGPGGIFWVLDSEPGVVQFFHHRPFQLSRAESLHLWMQEDEVRAALGEPNRVFAPRGRGFWYYYARNGTKLEVRFMSDGLGQANYCDIHTTCRSVDSLARELNGRSIYQISAERAGKRVQERWASHSSRSMRTQTISVESVEPAQAAGPEQKRTIPAQLLTDDLAGATREVVISRLGEPAFRSSISGEDGVRESLTYHLDSGQSVVVRLNAGRVVQIVR